MAIDVTPEQVLATAELARIRLRPEEVAPLVNDLRAILGYVAELSRLDLEGVTSAEVVGPERCPLRDDVPREGLDREEVLSQAPRASEGGFVVPRFVEE